MFPPKYSRLARVFFLSAILLTASITYSQRLSFSHFTVDQGLPSSTLYSSFQDSKGYMWFASDLGVSRYDGYSFVNFYTSDGLPDNEVFNFFEDSKGRIWFSTLNGRIGYYLNGLIYNDTRDTTLRQLNASSRLTDIFEDGGHTIWISSEKDGIYAYTKDKKVHRYFTNNSFFIINNFRQLPDSTFFLVSEWGVYNIAFSRGLDSVTSVREYIFTLDCAFYFSKSIPLTPTNMLFSDRGTIYAGNLSDETFSIFMQEKSDSVFVYNLCKDNKSLWICTNNGAIEYSTQEKKFNAPIFADKKVSSVHQDREGNYWITTLGDGLFFCSVDVMQRYTMEDGLISNKVTCLAKDNRGKVWLGFEKGIANSIHRGQVKSHVIMHRRFVNSCRVRKIFTSGEKVWFATSIGLSLLQGENLRFTLYNTRDVVEYPEDQLWVGTSKRFFKVNREHYNHFSIRLNDSPDGYNTGFDINFDIPSNREFARTKSFFLDSKKNIWISTEKRVHKVENDSVITIDPEKFNVTLQVNDFDELADQTIAMATNGHGVLLMKNSTYTQIDEGDGLSSGICNAIAADGNTLWVATNKGLNKVVQTNDSVKVEYFNIYDGLLSNEVNDVLVAGDTIWVATKNGVNFFSKSRLIKSKMRPVVHIENVVAHGKSIPLTEISGLELQHNENDVMIKFVSPFFNSIGAITYRYKLHPEAAWSYTKNPFVYLIALQPDDYQFIVQAQGRSALWSNEATFSFTVLKPFYATGFFIAAVVLMLMSIITAVVLNYIRNQKIKADMQQRIVVSELQTLRSQMNPHFLFNALNSIQDLFLKDDRRTAQHYISKFGKLMRSQLDHSSGSISIAEELNILTNYLEIEQLRMKHRFSFNISVDPRIDIHTTELPSMILQPFIENSIWHGFTETIVNAALNIDFRLLHDDYIIITIRDNGIGRRKSASTKQRKHQSKGITLINERINILNYNNDKKITLTIDDPEDDSGNCLGTLVTISIPLEI